MSNVPDDVREAVCAEIEESLRGISVGEDADGMSYGILDAIAEARHETDLRGAGDILRDASADILDAALSALEAAGWEVNRKGTREALEPFAKRARFLGPGFDDRYTVLFSLAACRRAAAMLTASRKEQPDV